MMGFFLVRHQRLGLTQSGPYPAPSQLCVAHSVVDRLHPSSSDATDWCGTSSDLCALPETVVGLRQQIDRPSRSLSWPFLAALLL